MRIVYDDTQQRNFVEIVEGVLEAMSEKDIASCVRYDYGMDRVQKYEILHRIERATKRKGFEVGGSESHAHGIGNNSEWPVFYVAPGEKQMIGSLHINQDPFGVVYIYVDDYNKKRISALYKVNTWGVQTA